MTLLKTLALALTFSCTACAENIRIAGDTVADAQVRACTLEQVGSLYVANCPESEELWLISLEDHETWLAAQLRDLEVEVSNLEADIEEILEENCKSKGKGKKLGHKK